MTNSFRRRIAALKANQQAERQPPFIVFVYEDREPVGIAAPRPSLPDVLRLPGESWDALEARAASQFRGSGPVVVFATYAADEGVESCMY